MPTSIIEPSLPILIMVWVYLAIGVSLAIYGIYALLKPNKIKAHRTYLPTAHAVDYGRQFNPAVVVYEGGSQIDYQIYHGSKNDTYESAKKAAINICKQPNKKRK